MALLVEKHAKIRQITVGDYLQRFLLAEDLAQKDPACSLERMHSYGEELQLKMVYLNIQYVFR